MKRQIQHIENNQQKKNFPTAKPNSSDRKQNRHINWNKLVTTKTNFSPQKQNRHSVKNKLVTTETNSYQRQKQKTKKETKLTHQKQIP